MIGSTLSHFRITGRLGAGGMGEVYRAEDSALGREVAIKVLPAAFTADPERLARFEREARTLASLSHPNIAGIFEVGRENGVHFLVMELARGETLADRLARGPIPLAEALRVVLQIAEALEAAHERGIVHRDLKPANVMVDAEGRVKGARLWPRQGARRLR
jgi:eukaryotic-like serine/threonine-protein kinase